VAFICNLGEAQIQAEYDLNKHFKVEQSCAKFNGVEVSGIIWVKILPPNMNVPFVPMLTEDRYIYPVCGKCAVEKQMEKCCMYSILKFNYIYVFIVHI
jgi:hypothetical protein